MPSEPTSTEIEDGSLVALQASVRGLYEARSSDVPFHGWPHIRFVRDKAIEFSSLIGADPKLVSASALTHDLNYIVEPGSEPTAGRSLRQRLLEDAGVPDVAKEHVEQTVLEAHTRTRGPNPSAAAKALSDADTLFKALPITPVALSCQFRAENGLTLGELADKIVSEQLPLLKDRIYFYIPEVEKRYREWAETNVALWAQVLQCLDEPDVLRLLQDLSMADPPT